MLNWSSPSIVLHTRPYGEVDGIVTLLSLDHGLYKGMVKAMTARKQLAIWQIGNFVEATWGARHSNQLGYFKAELVRPNFAFILSKPLEFSMLSSACAIAAECLFDHQPVPPITRALLKLITLLSLGEGYSFEELIIEYIRWELNLLSELGYGLDLSLCKNNIKDQQYWVSPKTGKAVPEEIAGIWKERLLKLPAFCINNQQTVVDTSEWLEGLTLTQFFLEKHVFNTVNKSIPFVRQFLIEKIEKLVMAQQ